MPITRHNITPLYEQIAEQLRQEIDGGSYEPSGLLPSEADLGARFDVSRVTVRLAVGRLAERGLVERQRGKGTFVKGKRLRHGLNTLRGFHDALVLQGLATDMRLLEVQKRPLPTTLRAEMHTRARIGLFLQRLHCVQGKPVALASTYLPPESVDLTPAQLGVRSSYAVIETLLGWRIQRARLSIRLEQVSSTAAKHLEMKSAASVMILERTSYITGEKACEHTLFEIRPDRFEFVLDSEGGPRPADSGGRMGKRQSSAGNA
jgi:GntR family transcriptional regulator